MFVLLNNLHIQQLDEQSKVMKNDFFHFKQRKTFAHRGRVGHLQTLVRATWSILLHRKVATLGFQTMSFTQTRAMLFSNTFTFLAQRSASSVVIYFCDFMCYVDHLSIAQWQSFKCMLTHLIWRCLGIEWLKQLCCVWDEFWDQFDSLIINLHI